MGHGLTLKRGIGGLIRFPLGIAALLALAACDPQDLADKTVSRAADRVVYDVLSRQMFPSQAGAATDCIIMGATNEERAALAQDIGVEAGTRTRANIRALAGRPAVAQCLGAKGLGVTL